MDRLQQLLNNLSIIQSTYPEDACIILADTEKVIGYVPGKTIDLKVPVGATAEDFKGSVSYNALMTGEIQKEERGPEAFGVAYISTATPILENGEVIGVISVIVLNNKVDTLRKGSKELTVTSEELSRTTEDITKVSELISEKLKDLSEKSASLKNNINQIENILDIIKGTAAKSRILGLNASIEAARSGEHGKGFAVVANEIKKLADTSKETVEGVVPQVKEMTMSLENMIANIQQISADSLEQTKIIEEFQISFERVVNIAANLYEQSKI